MARAPQSNVNAKISIGSPTASVLNSAPALVKSEPISNSPQPSSGTLIVAHTKRTMTAYNFTDSDLDLIGVSNVVSGVAFSLASFVGALCIDIRKDILLSGKSDEITSVLSFSVNWIGIPVVLAAVVVGIVAMRKKGSVISRVKRDSANS